MTIKIGDKLKKGKVAIALVIDKSSSMYGLRKDTIGGVNSFLDEQRKQEGEVLATLVLFSTKYDVAYNMVPIQNVQNLCEDTYIPGGMTALRDAMGTAIDEMGSALRNLPESEKPEKVIVVTMTDGEENSSKEYSSKRLAEMIKHQKDKYSWEFVFLGADESAFEVGASFGIDSNNSAVYGASTVGTRNLFKNVSKGLSRMRSGDKTDNGGYFLSSELEGMAEDADEANNKGWSSLANKIK